MILQIRILIILILSVLFINACQNKNSIYKDINNKLIKKEKRISIINPDTIFVYADASMSMQGFVLKNDYQVLIKNILTSFSDPSRLRLNLFDTSLISVSKYSDLFHPGNYKGYRANLDLIFDKILKEFLESENRLFLVITDFQFNNQNIYINTLSIFNKLLNNDALINIFGTEFDFQGLIFPQFVNQQPYLYSGKRPIYILLIGKHYHLNFITDFVKKTFNVQNWMTLSKEIYVDLKLEKSFSNGSVAIANQRENHFFVKDNKFSACFNIKIPEIYINNIFWNNNFDVQCYEYRPHEKNKFLRKNTDVSLDSIWFLNKENKLLLFLSNLDNVTISRNIYKIGFLPDKFPDWISKYSGIPTDNQANKTVYLKEFFEDLFRPVNEKNYLFTSYFILEKK